MPSRVPKGTAEGAGEEAWGEGRWLGQGSIPATAVLHAALTTA